MAGMGWADYGKDAPSGGGIRLRILYDAIVNRTPIEVDIPGGKAVIMTTDDVLADMKQVIDGKMDYDSPNAQNKQNFVGRHKGKTKLKAVQKNGKGNKCSEITFTKITKTVEFGSNQGSGAGSDKTSLFEGAACWVTAYRYSLGNTNIDVDYVITLDDLKKVSGSVETDESLEDIHQFILDDPVWMQSSIKTANKLYNTAKYRNKNFKFYRGTGVTEQIKNHYLKVNKENGRPFSDINKWSPADIYMCECDFDMNIFTKEMTFQGGINKVMKDLIKEKKLIGISLKKVTSSTPNLTDHNFTRASLTVKKPFVDIRSKTLLNSMDVYLEGTGVSVQFRATDSEGKTWQGEVMGTAAKHGRVGGGVVNHIMEGVYGKGNGVWKDYSSAAAVALAAKGNALDKKIFDLARDNKDRVMGPNEQVTKEDISRMRPQWKFAKYLGLLVVDQLMSGTKVQRDEITTRIYLYATSASDDSAPYIKIS